MAISPQRLTIYLYSAHRAVIFAIAQLSCYTCRGRRDEQADGRAELQHQYRTLHIVIHECRYAIKIWLKLNIYGMLYHCMTPSGLQYILHPRANVLDRPSDQYGPEKPPGLSVQSRCLGLISVSKNSWTFARSGYIVLRNGHRCIVR